jgi:hypothetical protein
MDLLAEMKSLTSDRAESGDDLAHMAADSQGRLWLVCYHLPIKITRTGDPAAPFTVAWTDSLIAKTSGSISADIGTFWLGTMSVPGDAPTGKENLHVQGQ